MWGWGFSSAALEPAWQVRGCVFDLRYQKNKTKKASKQTNTYQLLEGPALTNTACFFGAMDFSSAEPSTEQHLSDREALAS